MIVSFVISIAHVLYGHKRVYWQQNFAYLKLTIGMKNYALVKIFDLCPSKTLLTFKTMTNSKANKIKDFCFADK